MNEIYKRHRPKTFDEVLGQPGPVAMLKAMVARRDVPHATLFTGPSGCGKTTLARILAGAVGCVANDFVDMNASSSRGIDDIRGIQTTMSLSPMAGRARVWCIDEAHKLTNDAQNALLKTLEDTPKHVYFMLCTTDPNKLIKTIQTRCTVVGVNKLDDEVLEELLIKTAIAEGIELSETVKQRIMQCADGGARKALVMLGTIQGIDDEATQLSLIAKGDFEAEGIAICRALINGMAWAELAKLIKGCKEDPESLRYAVLGYCNTIVLSGGPKAGLAFNIIEAFSKNFYDSKLAGLVAACYWIAIAGKKK